MDGPSVTAEVVAAFLVALAPAVCRAWWHPPVLFAFCCTTLFSTWATTMEPFLGQVQLFVLVLVVVCCGPRDPIPAWPAWPLAWPPH